MSGAINVFREVLGTFQLVGRIGDGKEGPTFAYDGQYLITPGAVRISAALPLREEAFDKRETAAFFQGVLPEGSLRTMLERVGRTEPQDWDALLARLGMESTGALVFCDDGVDPAAARDYRPLSPGALASFAAQPREGALRSALRSRLSLAGAQAKVGLYHEGNDPEAGWSETVGTAPSTHIVKASDGNFPWQTVNEAVCMRAAKLLGYEVADVFLVPCGTGEPLIAVKRFDREVIEGLAFPARRHQEDFCQAGQVPGALKYEPTGASYLNYMCGIAREVSINPFSAAMGLFIQTSLCALVGNCDNHLKNYSLLWTADWTTVDIAPVYDLTCTTIYPSLDREMGVSLCNSRKIDDVDLHSMLERAAWCGIPQSIARGAIKDDVEAVLDALEAAGSELADEWDTQARTVAREIMKDVERRIAPLSRSLA